MCSIVIISQSEVTIPTDKGDTDTLDEFWFIDHVILDCREGGGATEGKHNRW